MTRALARIASWLVAAAILACASPSHAAEPVDSYVELARLRVLAARPEWLRLLHYHRGAIATESDVQPSAFFLSKEGRTDPGAELEATLRAFFEPQNPHDPDAHAICRFPARYEWLRSELALAIAAPRCPGLDSFIDHVHARSVSLVFTSNFLANPASMFGHTFLRMGRDEDRPPESLDDTTLEFTADVDTHNPILYVVKGVGGLFHGRYRYQRFAEKMVEYGASQDREMWDYDLDFTRAERERLVNHLWELESAKVDYYYFTGNCAFRLLEILEAAAPRLDLLSHLKSMVFPGDAVTALLYTPHLVKGVRYVPSARKRIKEQTEGLPIPKDKAPHFSHGPLRFDFGSGGDTQFAESFATIGFRLALHDMNDPPDGQPELATVQFMDTRVRYSTTHRSLTLDELTFAEIMSLNPIGPHEKLVSFRVRGFGERVHDTGCNGRDCFAHGGDFAGGITLATQDEHYSVFLMADAFFLFSPDFDGIGGSFVRAGVGPYGGIRTRIAPWLLGLATFTFSYLPAQNLKATFDARGSLRATLAKNAALGIEARGEPLGVEGRLEGYVYF